MLLLPARHGPVPVLQAWFAEDVTAVYGCLERAELVDVLQCTPAVADALSAVTYARREFETLLIDLSQTEAELLRALDPKSCRYEVNKARKLIDASPGDVVRRWERSETDAKHLIDAFMVRSGYAQPTADQLWRAGRESGALEIHTVSYHGRLVAAHVVLVDWPRRARLLFSATIDRADVALRSVIGPLNRWLHLEELFELRRRGFHEYDFGGVTTDRDSPVYAIGQFKRSFGGRIVREPIVRIARHASTRAILRGGLDARRTLAPTWRALTAKVGRSRSAP